MNLNVKMKTKSVTMVIIAESVLRKRPWMKDNHE